MLLLPHIDQFGYIENIPVAPGAVCNIYTVAVGKCLQDPDGRHTGSRACRHANVTQAWKNWR